MVVLVLLAALQPPNSEGDDAMEHICGVCRLVGVSGLLPTLSKSHEFTVIVDDGSSAADNVLVTPPFSSRERFGTRP